MDLLLDAGNTRLKWGLHDGAGWRGQGAVPSEHVPNQGVLMSIMLLADAADAIGEQEEAVRCEQLLDSSDTTARARLG